MAALHEKSDAEVREDHDRKPDEAEPGDPSSGPAPDEAPVEVDGECEPEEGRPELFRGPEPVSAPCQVGPDTAKDHGEGKQGYLNGYRVKGMRVSKTLALQQVLQVRFPGGESHAGEVAVFEEEDVPDALAEGAVLLYMVADAVVAPERVQAGTGACRRTDCQP